MSGWSQKLTQRLKRLIGAEPPPATKPPAPLGASQVIRPEEAIPHVGKPAPQPRPAERKVTMLLLPDGTVHVNFNATSPANSGDAVVVRDPITRRLSRHKIDGMKSADGFYKPDGSLHTAEHIKWIS